ncbi:MAG TPA: serine/threonine-protein kinase [Gemmatimonadaceae bacterium]
MLSTPREAGALDSPAVDGTRAVTADLAGPDAERARLEEASAGRYRIDALIGRGLFSTVFRATEIRGAGEVAIKLLDVGVRTTPEILEHLEGGQRACAALADEGVVAASSVEQHESATFLVMSLMHGGSLTELLRSRGALPLREVVEIVREVAATLDRIHAAGITHRGLTPGSILFDFSGRACIADIGITDSLIAAGALDESLTPPARAYAAPEQWRTQNIDGRADQYALALIAHEMLTGEPPRHRETVEGFRVLEPLGVLPDVPLRQGIPLSVNAALRKALSATTSNRFATTTQFAEALAGRSRHGLPGVSAPPPEVHVPHKGRVAAAIGALVLVLAFAAAVNSGLTSSVRSTWRTAVGYFARTPRKIESSTSSPTLALAPALALPPAPERTTAPTLKRTASSTGTNAIGAPRASSRTLPEATGARQRPSPSAERSVAVVSTGTVVDAPRRVAVKDAASGAASSVIVPSVTPKAPAAVPPPGETKSWLARLFSSDEPLAGLPLTAYIRVAVDRGIATVKIDGVDRGTAPLTALVNAGHHTVAVDGPVNYTSPSTGVVVASLDTVRVLFHAAKKR